MPVGAQNATTSPVPPLTAADFETPEYRADWGLAQIHAATAYARGFTGLGITVAVYDTGIDRNHPDFAGRISPDSRNFFLASDRTFYPEFVRDEQGHGTHVSGTIAAGRDGTGTMGVAYDSTILSLYGLPPATYGWLTISDFHVDYPAAITYAAERGARVYNGSYGLNFPPWYPMFKTYTFSHENMLAEYNAMKRAVDAGTLFVFAAGNNYERQPILSQNPGSAALLPYIKPSNAKSGVYRFYDIYRFIGDPLGHPIDQSAIDFSGVAGSVVAVVATDRDNTIASFSNRCGVAAAWCIAAPGVAILSTTPTDRGQPYAHMSGTSMAAPHVSGAAAVLMQAFPFLTAPQIAQTMFTTATHLGDGPANIPNATYGWGLLNLGKAIDGPGQFTRDWTVNTTYNGQAYDGTFANAISGIGGLTKVGAGTLELSGDNAYAGGTSVQGGTVAVWRDRNLGADGTGLTLGGGGRLRVLADGFSTARPVTLDGLGGLRVDTGSSTFAGVVADGSQPGFLLKDGSGTAVLTAANTHTGGTTVAAGTLALTAAGRLVAPVSVGPDGTFANAGLASGGVANAGRVTNSGTIAGGVSNSGALATSGAITGGLANAGWTQNSGAVAGGVSNGGTLATAGTLSGGLTNSGTITASAGRIDGAIRNAAGTLAITGAVASDGTFANAAGATLSVTGVYSLAGPLANAGTVAVARTASLTAPAGLSNAGLVASDGILTTDLTNTGTARLSGQLNGALTNTGSLLFTGPLAGLSGLTNAGPLDLGGGAFTLASLAGPASGVIGNGQLTVTGAASTTYAGAILQSTAPTSLTKAGTGTLTLTGTGRFSGPTTIQAGTLSLDGLWASPVTVASAGTLRGVGTIAAPVTVAGALRPGNSPGTLTVLGPVAFASGSRLGLDIDGVGTGTGAGTYARLLALGPTGAVAARGTLVPVLRGITGNATNAYTPALGQRLGVLTAQGGLAGSFAGLAQPAVGLPAGTRFDALYRATGLDLVVTPAAYGNLAGLGLAQTGNARGVGAALDGARPAAGTRPDADRARVFDALYGAGPATLPGGLASLSGQAYGDAVMADLAARRLVTDTIDRHLRGQGGGAAAFSAGDPGLGPNRSALQMRGAAGAPDRPLASGEGRVWAEAPYGFGSRAGDRAAAGADLDAGGLLLGLDRQVGTETLVGGAFSYLRETGSGQGSGQSFGPGRNTADSSGGTLYARTRLGAAILRGTAGLSYANGRIDRTVALGAAVSRASGLASGWDAGVSGFAGYALATGLPVELVPEVGFSVDRLTRGRVAERGGLASQRFATAGLDGTRSLAGGRLAVDGAAGLRLEARAYWAHEMGDTFATVRASLFGVPFATRTSALGRDGAVLGVSLTGPVAEGVMLSLSYTGDVRPGATAQVVSAGVQARW